MAKRVTFDDWERVCRHELQSLYDCLYETDAERRKTPYGPWAQSKFAMADKSRLNASNGEQGHAEEQDGHPQWELASSGRKGAKKRQKNEDKEEGHAPRSAWKKTLAVVVSP